MKTFLVIKHQGGAEIIRIREIEFVKARAENNKITIGLRSGRVIIIEHISKSSVERIIEYFSK